MNRLQRILVVIALAVLGMLVGCSTQPLRVKTDRPAPESALPLGVSKAVDRRGEFRQLFCALYRDAEVDAGERDCADLLIEFPAEPAAAGAPRPQLEPDDKRVIYVVLGVGWDCFGNWIDEKRLPIEYLRSLGYPVTVLPVAGLAGSDHNARMIRDVLAMRGDAGEGRDLLLIGYSKGAVDALQAIAEYPQVADRVAALISIAGSIGGSPLAEHIAESTLGLLRHVPGADCARGDGDLVASLTPQIRDKWLSDHTLPPQVHYYSIVTAPEPQRVSRIMHWSQHRLDAYDSRNDGNLLPRDQVIPGSDLLGYLNADHWAVALPIAESNAWLDDTLVDQNRFPRNLLWEALVRFVERDLELTSHPPAGR